MDEWIEILNIMEKYRNDCNDEWPFWAEHEVIGLNIDSMIISDEDMETWKELHNYSYNIREESKNE